MIDKNIHVKMTRNFKKIIRRPRAWVLKNRWHKLVSLLIASIMLLTGSMYGIAQWYIFSNRNKPLRYGVTFIPSYAEYFGLQPEETLQAIFNDLGAKNVRLVSYWKDIQSEGPNRYDFSGLDWQFKMAEKAGAKISLAIGLRQPRWPECHEPAWAKTMPKSEWQPLLYNYITEVVNHYKDNPALESYQLENEFFLKVFGKCTDFDRSRLEAEFAMVKKLDSHHPVIISRSNNAVGLPLGNPRPDLFGISVYKRVWDKTITKRYFEYPFPAWFYGFLAGAGKLLTGKDMIIHELQAEPWVPDGYALNTSPLAEQDKSMNAKRLKDRFEYGRATGMKDIDLWGVEWWYWRKVGANDPSIWDVAKTEFHKSE
jgi:hypothetical protein